MNIKPRSSQPFPQAIINVDGDAFFASCEQAANPLLRGKPVVTGRERGIASSMSYEAKNRGITRGMPIWQIKEICPDVVIVSSNHQLYKQYSTRMYNIVRRYTPKVEEYGIDECFADITGVNKLMNLSYSQIITTIKKDLDTELGMTFSIGLATTKVLAKIASKWDKPSGCISIPDNEITKFLKATPVGSLWGIGKQTSIFLDKHNISTAYDLSSKPLTWVRTHLTKPYRDIYREINGTKVLEVSTEPRKTPQSIITSRTFTPPSNKESYILKQLSKNIENACIKARSQNLWAKKFTISIKTQDFQSYSLNFTLDSATNTPNPIIKIIEPVISSLIQPGTMYRTTGITLHEIRTQPDQPDLFDHYVQTEKYVPIFQAVDDLSDKYGKNTLQLSSSVLDSARRSLAQKLTARTNRRTLAIPSLGMVN